MSVAMAQTLWSMGPTGLGPPMGQDLFNCYSNQHMKVRILNPPFLSHHSQRSTALLRWSGTNP